MRFVRHSALVIRHLFRDLAAGVPDISLITNFTRKSNRDDLPASALPASGSRGRPSCVGPLSHPAPPLFRYAKVKRKKSKVKSCTLPGASRTEMFTAMVSRFATVRATSTEPTEGVCHKRLYTALRSHVNDIPHRVHNLGRLANLNFRSCPL